MSKFRKRIRSSLARFLVLLTLLSMLPTPAKAAREWPSGMQPVVVSLGDSFSSGESIEPYYDSDLPLKEKVHSQDWCAHRSTTSWPSMLKYESIGPLVRDDNWYFVATSGAETKHLTGSFKKNYDKGSKKNPLAGSTYIDPQLDVFDDLAYEGKLAKYVTMTMGGNDADFAGIIEKTVRESLINALTPNSITDELNLVWEEFYRDGGIRDDLRQAYQDVAKAAGEQATIIVAGYPKLIHKDAKGVYFTKRSSAPVNEAIVRFNAEIEALVNSCKADGMRICFVSVLEEFDGHEAGAPDPYINTIALFSKDEDINDGDISASSMHPNEKGARAYARCVQRKIDQLEKDDGASEFPERVRSKELEVVLVLDTSGSMLGTPIQETREASIKFIETVLQQDASIGIVAYDYDAMKISDFSAIGSQLKSTVQRLSAGGSTNTEGGLALAHEMLKTSEAKKKIIVLMSDGVPNIGREGDALIEYANSIKADGISIFTLGFFSDLGDGEKTSAQYLMDGIASEGKHYEVSRAEDLVLFFGDIADQISDTRYIYIKIACPVDVTVTYNGETLTSVDNLTGQRADFGTITFEENPNPDDDESTDDRIKILRLKEGADYDIQIEGNGKGKMTYTIGFVDEDGEYSDMRKFSNIKITKRTEIQTTAANTSATYLKVDKDGDGVYEDVYKAEKDSRGEMMDLSYVNYIGLAVVGVIILLLLSAYLVKRAQKKQEQQPESTDTPTEPPHTPADEKNTAQEEKSEVPTPVAETQAPPADPANRPVPPPAFCTKCGRKRTPGAQFCTGCGAKFNQ